MTDLPDGISFSSGRSIYANCGIVGIDAKGVISEGYDGGVEWPPSKYNGSKLTADDMRELADVMIARWAAFKKALD